MQKEQPKPEEVEEVNQEQTHQDETTTTSTTARPMTDEEATRAYVADPEVRANHLKMAEQLQSIFGTKWFTIDMINKKTLMKDKPTAMQMMIGLQLFNMVTSAEGGINYKHQTKFKITISVEDRLKVLEEHKNNHLKQIGLIEKEIESLKLEQSNSEKSEK